MNPHRNEIPPPPRVPTVDERAERYYGVGTDLILIGVAAVLLLAAFVMGSLGCVDVSKLQEGAKVANQAVVAGEKCFLDQQEVQNEACLLLPFKENAEQCIKNVTAAYVHVFELFDEYRRFRCILETGAVSEEAIEKCVEDSRPPLPPELGGEGEGGGDAR